MEIGRDAAEAGGPNHQIMVSHGHGVASTGNSLAAIKKLVFDDKRVT